MSARFTSLTRWFDEALVGRGVKSLVAEVERIPALSPDEAGPLRPDNSQKLAWIVGAGALGLLLLLVLILALFGNRNPNHQLTPRSMVSLGLIFIVLPVGLYFGTKHFSGVRTQRMRERDAALRTLAARTPSLEFGRLTRLAGESVGRIPWLASELDEVVGCDLHGELRGHRLALLQCTYVVDMTLTAMDSSFGGVAAKIMSHVQHEHIHRRSLEAVVFLDPVPDLPDAYSAPKKQPLNWYFKRQLQQNGTADLTPLVSDDRWIVSSNQEAGVRRIQGPTARLLQSRPEAMIQVLGGYVVVIPQLWNSNWPKEMPCDPATIEQNLHWACDVFEALGGSAGTDSPPLRRASTGVPATAWEATTGPARTTTAAQATAPSPAAAATIQAPRRPRSVMQIVAGLFGLLLLGVGGIAALGVVALNAKAAGAAKWPTVEGRIVSAEVQERAGPQFSARIQYTYEVGGEQLKGDKYTLATTEWLAERAAIEAVVAKHPPGAGAKVYYNPRNSREAILEPRLADSGMGAAVMVIAAVLGVVGIALMVFGIRRPRVSG